MDSYTSKTHVSRLGRVLALMAVLIVAALGLASAAGAEDGFDPDTDPPIKTVPNLTIGGSVAPYGSSEWELRYTVSNRGNGPAGAFRVAVEQNGSALIKSTAYASLDAGASRSEVIHIPRTSCYISVRFTADSARVVTESSEYDNTRWAVTYTSPTCPTLPKYQVKAVSFHANDETGIDWLGSDEPYWIFNSVGMNGTSLSTASHTFGNIDTGDTASFGATEGCVYLSCSGGAAPNGIGFSIQLWEHDLGYVPQTLSDTALAFHELGGILEPLGGELTWLGKASTYMGDAVNYLASWSADDLIGSQTYVFNPAYLANRLPATGGSFTDTRTYSGGGGEYTLTMAITRVG
jgi:hypothetical protein